MFIFEKMKRRYRISFWLDEPAHFTFVNIQIMGISLFALFVLAGVGLGVTLLGFNLIIHSRNFGKKYDKHMDEAAMRIKEQEEVDKKISAAQLGLVKKRRRKK